MISRDTDDSSDDPFLEADRILELDRLIDETGDGGCSTQEFVCGDDDLQVCVDIYGED